MTGQKYRALVLQDKLKVAVETWETQPLESGWVRVKLAAAGICGSDMHYYKNFGNVGFTLKNPIVLGHEASGVVAEVGPGVASLKVGDKVAVNPLMNCGMCLPCRRGDINLCENTRFPSSAMNYPHIHGYFREYFEAAARCCIKVPDDTDLFKLAFAEPLSCSTHAVMLAGGLVGKNVLVTGSGPIGVLAAAAAKAAGAGNIMITDITDEPLATAKKMGATYAVNTMKTPLEEALGQMGPLDVAIEASGAVSAIAGCMNNLRKGGVMVQLGTPPAVDLSVPWIRFMQKEIKVFGSMRFTTEFDLATQFILRGVIDPVPMLSRQFAFEDAVEAFAAAADRSKYMKIQFIP